MYCEGMHVVWEGCRPVVKNVAAGRVVTRIASNTFGEHKDFYWFVLTMPQYAVAKENALLYYRLHIGQTWLTLANASARAKSLDDAVALDYMVHNTPLERVGLHTGRILVPPAYEHLRLLTPQKESVLLDLTIPLIDRLHFADKNG